MLFPLLHVVSHVLQGTEHFIVALSSSVTKSMPINLMYTKIKLQVSQVSSLASHLVLCTTGLKAIWKIMWFWKLGFYVPIKLVFQLKYLI